LLGKNANLDRKSLLELQNVRYTAEMQVAICEGIFLSSVSGNAPRSDKYNVERIPVHSMFSEWKRTLAPICENYGLDYAGIKVDISIPEINFDIRALQALFLNIGVNALKYGNNHFSDGDRFRYSITSESVFEVGSYVDASYLIGLEVPPGIRNHGYHVLTFEDNGIGIDEKFKERIFDLYFRIDSDASRFRSGMGVGLSMVRQICQEFYGGVWVSRGKNPTRIKVAFPMFLESSSFTLTKSWRGV